MQGKRTPDGYPASVRQALLGHGLLDSLGATDDQVEATLASLCGCRRADLRSRRVTPTAAQIEALVNARRHVEARLTITQLGLSGLPSAGPGQVWL
jgi:hypothetical protein